MTPNTAKSIATLILEKQVNKMAEISVTKLRKNFDGFKTRTFFRSEDGEFSNFGRI
jgi:hypothetical protein